MISNLLPINLFAAILLLAWGLGNIKEGKTKFGYFCLFFSAWNTAVFVLCCMKD